MYPALSGPCPDSSFSILLCKDIVKDFFQILDAGRCPAPDGAERPERQALLVLFTIYIV